MFPNRHSHFFFASKTRTILSLVLLGGLVALAFGAIQASVAQAQSDKPIVFVDETDAATGIQYGASYADGQLNGGVLIDTTSVEGIRAYISFNLQNTHELLKTDRKLLYVHVVFNHPLSQDEFEQLVKAYALKPYAYSIRAIAPDSTRATIYGGPADGKLIPTDLLDMVSQDLQQRDGSTIKGWVEVSTIVQSADLVSLLSNPMVYTIDVTETLLRNAITFEKLQAVEVEDTVVQMYLKGQAQIQISRPPLYWFLEEYGLVTSN